MDARRWYAVFYPVDQGRERVEAVGPNAAPAVEHAADHEQPEELLGAGPVGDGGPFLEGSIPPTLKHSPPSGRHSRARIPRAQIAQGSTSQECPLPSVPDPSLLPPSLHSATHAAFQTASRGCAFVAIALDTSFCRLRQEIRPRVCLLRGIFIDMLAGAEYMTDQRSSLTGSVDLHGPIEDSAWL